MLLILVLVLGAVWGSFIHATSLRVERFLLNSNILISNSKTMRYQNYLRISLKNFFCNSYSRCDHCKVKIPWFFNIPLVSFFVLGGKCSHCKNKISPLILISEFIFSLIFLLIYIKFPDSLQHQFFALIFFSLIFLITHFDLKYLLIPDQYTYLVLWFGLFAALFGLFGLNIENSIYTILIIFLILKGTSLFYVIALKKDVLGEGDPMLAASLSCWIGFDLFPLFLFLASLLGIIVIIYSKFKSTNQDVWQLRLAFGPPLCISAGLIFLFKLFTNI
jgi:leader peptidase (prepilin peptidase)/N-methyltransferase